MIPNVIKNDTTLNPSPPSSRTGSLAASKEFSDALNMLSLSMLLVSTILSHILLRLLFRSVLSLLERMCRD